MNISKKKQTDLLKAYRGQGDTQISYRDLGELIGVSHETARKWCEGIVVPDYNMLYDLHIKHQSTGRRLSAEIVHNLMAVQYPKLFEPLGEIGKKTIYFLETSEDKLIEPS